MDEHDDASRTIFCANLHENVTEEILYELFLQAGPLEKVKIISNNNYGFITYQHDCSVDYALEVFKDTSLYGLKLRLRRRQPKQDYDIRTNMFNPLQNPLNNMYLTPNSRNGDSRHSYRSRSPRRDNRPPSRNYDNRHKRYDYDDKYSDQRHNHNDRRNHKRYKR